jgi:hypothetical protein
MVARAVHGMGGDVMVYDRANSYGELHRQAILKGVCRFVEHLSRDEREKAGRCLAEAAARTVFGGPRRVIAFADGVQATSHALTQGSPESSVLEAFNGTEGRAQRVHQARVPR